jgi:multidrug resistance efflux pump
VAHAQAELDQALFYLDNTTMVAPEDGFVTNLQVRPGMVAGEFRIGAIASFIVDADRYLLGTFYQEQLKYVENGQPVEVALDLHPGQIFKGKVDTIWWASGQGQLLPSGQLPTFNPPPKEFQGRFAVKIYFDAEYRDKFPIGAQGAAAIYTGGGGFAALRRIVIRTYTWLNWLYPIPF